MRNIFIPFYLLVFFSCKQESLPKPKAYLNLQYSNNEYKILPLDRPYLFDISNFLTTNSKCKQSSFYQPLKGADEYNL